MDKTYFFILATFNDIDHQTPVIWKMAKQGLRVRVLFADRDSNMNIRTNANAQLLKREVGVEVLYYYAFLKNGFRLPNICLTRISNPLILKISRWILAQFKKIIWTDRWAVSVLRQVNPAVCIADIHALEWNTIEGKLVKAAKKLGVPVVGVTHGPDVYTNFDSKDPSLKRPPRKKNTFDDPRYKAYDYIVSTTPHEAEMWRSQGGFEASRVPVLGLPRYSKDWVQKKDATLAPYESKKNCEGKLRVLFFMPHWREHVHREKTLAGIEAIARLDFVHLIVKEHTREGAGNLPLDLRTRLQTKPNVEIISSSETISFKEWVRRGFRESDSFKPVDSAALVSWADVVICFATSIGIEAICQSKPLINPVYMYTYATVYDALGANILVENQEELLEALSRLKNDPKQIPYDPQRFFNTVVFAEKNPHDILQSYADFIVLRSNQHG